MFHSVSLFSQAPLARGSRALPSILFLMQPCRSVQDVAPDPLPKEKGSGSLHSGMDNLRVSSSSSSSSSTCGRSLPFDWSVTKMTAMSAEQPHLLK